MTGQRTEVTVVDGCDGLTPDMLRKGEWYESEWARRTVRTIPIDPFTGRALLGGRARKA